MVGPGLKKHISYVREGTQDQDSVVLCLKNHIKRTVDGQFVVIHEG